MWIWLFFKTHVCDQHQPKSNIDEPPVHRIDVWPWLLLARHVGIWEARFFPAAWKTRSILFIFLSLVPHTPWGLPKGEQPSLGSCWGWAHSNLLFHAVPHPLKLRNTLYSVEIKLISDSHTERNQMESQWVRNWISISLLTLRSPLRCHLTLPILLLNLQNERKGEDWTQSPLSFKISSFKIFLSLTFSGEVVKRFGWCWHGGLSSRLLGHPGPGFGSDISSVTLAYSACSWGNLEANRLNWWSLRSFSDLRGKDPVSKLSVASLNIKPSPLIWNGTGLHQPFLDMLNQWFLSQRSSKQQWESTSKFQCFKIPESV